MTTESILTISPKTSQISTRPVSPGLYPPSSSHDDPSYSQEKLQLRKLNDRFLSYIERVRIFETYNHCLTIHCEHIQNAQIRTKEKLKSLQEEFDEYQHEKSDREKKDLQFEYVNIHQNEEQVINLKNKQSFCQHEHESYRKQIVDLQKQSIDLQGKTDALRFEYENLNDDNNHHRKQLSYYQLLKSAIVNEITRQRDIHQRLQIEVEDLKMQKQISVQAHEADAQAIEIQNDNILYDLTNSFRFDGHGKNLLSQMLNEIREEYQTKDHDMRDELHRKYLYEYNQHMKKQVDQNIVGINREDLERRQLTNELNSLDDNRLLLRQKVALVQEHYKQLEMNFQREIKRRKEMDEKYEHQIKDLRVSVQEYENLLGNKSLFRRPTIENEVNKYRQLLEGSDQQIGLRQLINISNKLDRITPIHRSTTPPPPPSPIHKSDSSSTLLVRPSLTRENSLSENSYETALISQLSTNTTTNNQPYVTLDSPNEKLFHSDYDTDNDQSQTIQYMSGRSSRLTSETDATPTVLTPVDRESLPPLPPTESTMHDETIVEISIDTTYNEVPINQTLPFVPMSILTSVEIEEKINLISDEQQAPVISTLEKREEIDNQNIEPMISPVTETIIPITIEIDPKPVENPIELKIISPSTPTISADEPSKPTVSPVSTVDQTTTESTAVEVPIPTVTTTNPLAKLMSTMLPNATPFVPTSNGTTNRPVSPTPVSTSSMNNDAAPFIPSQQQHGSNQQHLSNVNTGHWNATNARGGSGNRRGQSGGGGFHHGGGNQRSSGGGNWQQGGHHKPRRGGK